MNDATDDPLHGEQEGRFFHGYHDGYCYLPLCVFWGDRLLVGKLRKADVDASAGASDEIARLARQVRARVVLRADSGFARDRLPAAPSPPTLPGRANPRFIVGSPSPEKREARSLYEKRHCARGEMENRIEECQRDLFADRTSSHTMQANELRLGFASFAYVLMSALRRVGLSGTRLATATPGAIRPKRLKIGALVKISVRRVLFSMASAFPYVDSTVCTQVG